MAGVVGTSGTGWKASGVSRGLWFLTGAGAGLYAAWRGRCVAEAVSAEGLADRLHAAAVGLRLFGAEVAVGRVEKESQLRERLGLLPHGSPQLEAGGDRTDRGETTDRTHDEDGSS